jgi:protein TonB
MTAAAFSPAMKPNKTALTAVVLIHGAAIGALLLAKGPDVIRQVFTPIDVFRVKVDPPPPPKPLPRPEVQLPQQRQVIDLPKPIIDLPPKPVLAIDATPVTLTLNTTHTEVLTRSAFADVTPEPKKVEPARARANLASYVSDADYPAEAIRREEQGVTRFRLVVSADGRVSDCAVTGSSGSTALDSATCRLMKSRARFAPARDSDGRPTGDTVANAIKWVLPEG